MSEPSKNTESKIYLQEPVLQDPSTLTTNQVHREIMHLKELLLQKTTSMQNAIDVAHEDLVRVPTDVQKQVGGLKELHETKIFYESRIVMLQITHLEKQFDWVEKMRLEQKKDSTEALTAAFNAANKQIDQLAGLLNTISGALHDKIADVKDTQIRNEASTQGKDTGKGNLSNWLIAIGGLVIGFISLLVVLYKVL